MSYRIFLPSFQEPRESEAFVGMLQLLLTFLKIGTFVFGGGYAMIPAIQREVVERQHWMEPLELTDCMAVCQSLPGAFAINVAIFVGKKVKGIPGAFIACIGMVSPAFLAILLVLLFAGRIEENHVANGAVQGIMVASIALILTTGLRMGKASLKGIASYLIAAVTFLLISLWNVNAVLLILAGGVFGYLRIKVLRNKGGDRV